MNRHEFSRHSAATKKPAVAATGRYRPEVDLGKAGSDLQKVDVVQVLIDAIDCANVFESCSVLLCKGEELGIMARALAATICRRS